MCRQFCLLVLERAVILEDELSDRGRNVILPRQWIIDFRGSYRTKVCFTLSYERRSVI